jgi:hypothetical protein
MRGLVIGLMALCAVVALVVAMPDQAQAGGGFGGLSLAECNAIQAHNFVQAQAHSFAHVNARVFARQAAFERHVQANAFARALAKQQRRNFQTQAAFAALAAQNRRSTGQGFFGSIQARIDARRLDRAAGAAARTLNRGF